MRDPGDILFNDDLTPEEFEAFRIGLSERPKSRAELSRGVGLLRAVHHRIESALPDRRLLVYEALRRAGREDALDRSERLSLEESRETLDLVLRRHPGVNDVVDGVTRDVSLFEDAWNGEFGTSTTTDRLRSNGFAEGRPPRRHGSHSGRSPLLRWSWRVTAAIAVVVFVAVAVLVGQRENGLISIATLEGETRLVELADGSRVHLLPNSTLSYHADDRDAGFTRFARLEGDGFFEIARDREGFTIEASTAVVVVLGTSFGIRASDEQAEIYLASGRLSVAARD